SHPCPATPRAVKHLADPPKVEGEDRQTGLEGARDGLPVTSRDQGDRACGALPTDPHGGQADSRLGLDDPELGIPFAFLLSRYPLAPHRRSFFGPAEALAQKGAAGGRAIGLLRSGQWLDPLPEDVADRAVLFRQVAAQ